MNIEMKEKLQTELRNAPTFEELVGDIRLLRFLRDAKLNVDMVNFGGHLFHSILFLFLLSSLILCGI